MLFSNSFVVAHIHATYLATRGVRRRAYLYIGQYGDEWFQTNETLSQPWVMVNRRITCCTRRRPLRWFANLAYYGARLPSLPAPPHRHRLLRSPPHGVRALCALRIIALSHCIFSLSCRKTRRAHRFEQDV